MHEMMDGQDGALSDASSDERMSDVLELPTLDRDVVWPPRGCLQSRQVSDSVHKQIELPRPLTDIIDTVEFQRLRDIKQLGLASHVFPSASHSRFEHSLGVCHLARRWVERLRIQLDDERADVRITDVDHLCVAIAALCHDLGHGPFSHVFDGQFMAKADPERKWQHEEGSVAMLKHLRAKNPEVERQLRLYLTDDDFDFINACISGKQLPEGHSRACKAFLCDIVANKRDGFDVDRFDYFLRDSKLTIGETGFSAETVERLRGGARVCRLDDGTERICYPDKMHDALLAVGHARSVLHRSVYQHKTCKAVESLITEALLAANEYLMIEGDGGRVYKLSDCVDHMDAFAKLTDHVKALIVHSSHPSMDTAKALIKRLHERKLDHLIGQTNCRHDQACDKDTIPADVAALSNGLLKAEDLKIYSSTVHHGMGRRNPLQLVYVYNQKRPDEPPRKPRDTELGKTLQPKAFEEQFVYLYGRHYLSEEQRDAAFDAFKLWCDRHKLSPEKRLTPIKASSPKADPETPRRRRTAKSVARNLGRQL